MVLNHSDFQDSLKTKLILIYIFVSHVFIGCNESTRNSKRELQTNKKQNTKDKQIVAIRGRVLNSETNQPIRNVFIVIEGTEIKTMTDSYGDFMIKAPRGMKELSFYTKGFKVLKVYIEHKYEMNIEIGLLPEEN